MVKLNLKDISTADLVAELSKREGVKEFPVEPHEFFQLLTPNDCINPGFGPARVLVVTD